MVTSLADAPHELREVAVTTIWPTIGATAAGRLVGRLAGIRKGLGFLTLGRVWALATIPISLAVFCWQLMPYVCRRYLLTNHRIVIQKGLSAVEERSIGLDEFDAVDIVVLPGQEWLKAGEVVLRRDGTELLRLSGVSRPEVFRQVCLKARTALVSFCEPTGQKAHADA